MMTLKRGTVFAVSIGILISYIGCEPEQSSVSPDALAADSEPVVRGDAIYFLSKAAGQVVRVLPGAQGDVAYSSLEDVTIETIPVGDAPIHMVATPDRRQLLIPNHSATVDSLAVVDLDKNCGQDSNSEPACVMTLEARALHDMLVTSPDSRFALSYISLQSAANSTEDIINLNEVGIYDLNNGSVRFATVGFNPRAFAFTTQDSANPRAVLLTSSQVVLLELLTGETTTRELTLDSSTQLTPMEVVITGDDHYALVTIENSPDLFQFDLTQSSLPINILSLTGNPSSMKLSPAGDSTLILVNAGYDLNVIQHQTAEVQTLELSGRMEQILVDSNASFAALFSVDDQLNYLDCYDYSDQRIESYLLDNPVSQVYISPDGGAVVMFYVPDGYYNSSDGDSTINSNYAVAILNIAEGDRQPNPILLSGRPEWAAFTMGLTPELNRVFVAIDDYDHGVVGSFDLSSYDSVAVETPIRPRGIGVLSGDNRVVVIHESVTGLISIFPSNQPEQIQFISGFLTTDIF